MRKPTERQPDFSAFGRRGALARARQLSAKERQEIARKAALARHERTPKKQRQEAARRAVLARWKKYRASKKKTQHP
jgi:hypothetical protein